MTWIVRLVKLAADGEDQSVDVMTINRPDDLSEIANLGLTLAEGKLLLAGLQQQVVWGEAGEPCPSDGRIAEAVVLFAESIQSCGVHYDASAAASLPFAG